MNDAGNAQATELEAPRTTPLATKDAAPYLFVKEELPWVIVVPAEDRVIRVPRRA